MAHLAEARELASCIHHVMEIKGLQRVIRTLRSAHCRRISVAATILLLLASPLCSQVNPHFDQQPTPAPKPNWALPKLHDTSNDPYLGGVWKTRPKSSEMAFTFQFSQSQRQTSAAVYDSTGKLVRTLWMNRAYNRGTFGEIWDGKDDNGNAVPNGSYSIKVQGNNIRYDWDGIIGNTETSWSGPNNWDGVPSSFPRDIAFLGGQGYVAGGYSEMGYEAAQFDEGSPNTNIRALNKNIFQGVQTFAEAATDGTLLYFGMEFEGNYRLIQYTHSGVIAFTPDGEPFSFSAGVPVSNKELWNISRKGTPDHFVAYPSLKIADGCIPTDCVVTGIAVQRNGQVLATAHGYFKPRDGNQGKAVPSSDKVFLWDKKTGAPLGSIIVPNPQKMAFDLAGNLWVISGWASHDVLYEIRDVGRSNAVSESTLNLSNPMSVAVSPVSGHLFIADGGVSQQVKEIDPRSKRLISSLGVPGGYGQGNACNASVDPQGPDRPTFYFDPANVTAIHMAGISSPFLSFVSVDEHGDLWVGDFSTFRILHFTESGAGWKYVNRIMYSPWDWSVAAVRADPTRVFGGPTGMNEFSVDYKVPLRPGDPDDQPGPPAWRLTRDWMACIGTRGFPNGVAAEVHDVEVLPNGKTMYLSGNGTLSLFLLDDSGTIAAAKQQPTANSYQALGPDGAVYQVRVTSSEGQHKYNFEKFAISSYDAEGFPIWSSKPADLGSYIPNHFMGDPIENSPTGSNAWPTVNGIMPVYEGRLNSDVKGSSPAFHLGGVPVGGTALKWRSMPEKDIPYTDGDGSFPKAPIAQLATQGVDAKASSDTNDIIAYFNGNNGHYSCQFYHFRDDGLFLGQFGFQTGPGYPVTSNGWGDWGYPTKGLNAALAPGECGDATHWALVKVQSDFYLYVGDENYHHGLHRWHISNLGSESSQAATGNLGTTLSLH